jgi:hypothetical protein
MSEDGRHGGASPGESPGETAQDGVAPDLRALARDWITLWQSELAALAVDREAQETWHTMLALWAGAAGAMLTAAPRERPGRGAPRHAGGHAGPAASPGTAPAAAAPDPRDAEIERLARHVRELEARLAEIEHGLRDGNGGGRRRPGQRRG